MKIFATSDLHIVDKDSDVLKELKKHVYHNNPDVVVISGDIYDNRLIEPFGELSTIGIPVVFCLGNHEFAYRTVRNTLNLYSFNSTTNVYCLDVCGHVDINGVRFVGNVLWYDGSLSERLDKNEKIDNIVENWLDCTIENFNALEENKKCINQIKENLDNYTGKSVLVTHTVPYWKLNQFCYEQPNGIYNIYSGVYDLFEKYDISVDVCVCGHTHRKSRVFYQENGKEIKCYNIGNEYFQYHKELKYEIIEI